MFSETENSGDFYGDVVQALFYPIHSSQISQVSTSEGLKDGADSPGLSLSFGTAIKSPKSDSHFIHFCMTEAGVVVLTSNIRGDILAKAM